MSSKTILIRAKPDSEVPSGAIPVPGEDGFFLVDIPNVVRIGKVCKKRKMIEFATERIIIGFENLTPQEVVKDIIGPDATSIKPIEKDATEDWSWIVKLKPGLDPEVIARKVSYDGRVLCAEPDRVRMVKKRTTIKI